MERTILIANTFLKYAKDEGIKLNHMKLQRLIYLFYKEVLQSLDIKVFSEPFHVWQHGPVLLSVHTIFGKYKEKPITDFYVEDKDIFYTLDLTRELTLARIFERVWATYKNYNATYLAMLTNKADTAWDKALKRKDVILSDNDIYEEQTLFKPHP